MNPTARLLKILLTLTGALFLFSTDSFAVPIEHGTITVPTGAARSLSPVTSPRVTLGGEINFGDYAVDVDPIGSNNDGVMIATIAENNPDGRYPSVSVFPNGPLERSWIGVYYPASNSLSNEWDSNVAFAFFSDEDFDWAIAGTGGTNGEVITSANLRSSSSVSFGTNFFDNADGTYTFDLTPTDPAKSSQNGILLTNGSRNEGNFTLARAETDGSFTIYNHDNGRDGTVYERDAVRCVYIPTSHGRDDIAAMGRIDGAGNSIIADDGVFTVTESATNGIWFLSIPGHSPDTGTLILTPEGGAVRNVDNLWSYQWDSTNQHWEIHTRDINSSGDPAPTSFQDMLTEPVFSFAFVVNTQVIPLDPIEEYTLSFPQQDVAVCQSWLPDTTSFIFGNGFDYNLTPVSSTGTLSFVSSPVIDPTGKLSFTVSAQTHGTAIFDVTISDPLGQFTTSGVQPLTITVVDGILPEEANLQPSLPLRAYICVTGTFPSGPVPADGDVLSEIKFFASDTVSPNYLPAEGQLLPISQNSALFSLLGTIHGGNGETNFALPDLRGRVPIGAGTGPGLTNYSLGDTGGFPSIDSANVPGHSHSTLAGETEEASVGVSYPNRQPYIALRPVISLNGVFPSPGAPCVSTNSYLSEVRWFPGYSAEFTEASGQVLPISSNTALFALLGITYGGNGQSTFALPDLRGRAVVAAGSGAGLTPRSAGDTFGTETETVTHATMPAHDHDLPAGGVSGPTGGGQAINNMMPSIAMHYVVCPDTGEVRLMATASAILQDPGDGQMGRPDLYGRVIVGESDELPYFIIKGNESVALTEQQLAGHSHTGPAYLDWISQFYSGETDPNIVGLLSAPGGQLPNVLQFVLDADPTTADPSVRPELSRDATNATFVFRRRNDATDRDPYVEYSSTLTGWTRAVDGANGVTITVEIDGFATGIDKVTVTIPHGGAPDLFARLAVDTP